MWVKRKATTKERLSWFHRILMMVYSTQNYCFLLDFSLSSCVLGSINTTFRKLDLFLTSAEEMGVTWVVQWLRLALSKGPNWVGVFSSLHLRTETDPLSEMSPENTGRWKRSKFSVKYGCFPMMIMMIGWLMNGDLEGNDIGLNEVLPKTPYDGKSPNSV
jgi:hypothetical protein